MVVHIHVQINFYLTLIYVKYNIVFDWYINIPFGVPDWVLP